MILDLQLCTMLIGSQENSTLSLVILQGLKKSKIDSQKHILHNNMVYYFTNCIILLSMHLTTANKWKAEH